MWLRMTIAVYESYSWKGRPHGFRVLVGGVADVVGHLVATGDSLTEGVGDPVDGIEMFGVGRSLPQGRLFGVLT